MYWHLQNVSFIITNTLSFSAPQAIRLQSLHQVRATERPPSHEIYLVGQLFMEVRPDETTTLILELLQ